MGKALVLELCEERLLPILCCPIEHRGAWFTAALPTSVGPDMWQGFALDQQYAMALRDGAEMQDAFDAVCNFTALPHAPLIVLGDVRQSQGHIDDRSRDILLARAAAAAVLLGNEEVLVVIGQDHVRDVAKALSDCADVSHTSEFDVADLSRNHLRTSASQSTSSVVDALEVPVSSNANFSARALFLGPDAVESIRKRREQLCSLCLPSQLHNRMNSAPSEALREFAVLSGLKGKSRFVDELLGSGAAMQPAKLSDLRQWWSSLAKL